MIRIQGLEKFYNKGRESEIHVLNNVTLDLPERGMVAIFGKSGCGKTTLLNTIGGLDTFMSGSLTVDGKSIRENTDALRNEYIGYIFQNYNLDKDATCYDNVAAALVLCGMTDAQKIRVRVMAALANVGMEKYALRSPDTLSGGQQQRIAIARAIVKNPRIILADEPTGNLDESNTVMIMDLLKEISRDHLVLLVTHEESLVDYYCDRVIELSDGRVVGERSNAAAEGYVARDKNHIFLGELAEHTLEDESASLTYYGEKPQEPLHITVVNQGGKVYLRVDTPDVQVLDDSAEIRLIEGVYKESAKEENAERRIDMSLLPPVKGTRYGRLFTLRSSIRSGYKRSFQSRKKRGRGLRACMALFAAMLVFMSAIFGRAFGDLSKVQNAYNHNVFYVYTTEAAVSEKLNAAVGEAETGIDYIRLMRYFPDGDEEFHFRTASFETFEPPFDYESGLRTNAVCLGDSLAKDLKLLAGKREGLMQEEILITSRVADALLEKSTLGYITEYEDLIGLISYYHFVEGKSLRIGGIVENDESAVYLSELAMAKVVKGEFYSYYYMPASSLGMSVKDGEATLMVKLDVGSDPLPQLNETIKLRGMDFKVTKIRENDDYNSFLSKQSTTKLSSEAYFTEMLKAKDPSLTEGTDAFKTALAALTNEHYFEYCDYYYEHIEAYLSEIYPFRDDDIDLWLYMEKGIEDAKYCYMEQSYFKAMQYKEINGSYPKKDEVATLCADLPDPYENLLPYYSLYEEEFYSAYNAYGLTNVTYLVSDADYISLSKRVGETHPSAFYKAANEFFEDEMWPGYIDYDSAIYTVIHSEDPDKTAAWLATAFSDLEDPNDSYKAIIAPSAVRAALMAESASSIVTNLVTMAVLLALMSLCMYFIMRSSLMGRIKEVGVLRAIGVSKKNLVFRFFTEAAVLTVLTVCVGYLVTSLFMALCFRLSPFADAVFYYPFWLAGADLLILLAISLFFGTLPILTLLRKTPSEILAKYDV